MGYNMSQMDTDFRILCENKERALEAIKGLEGKETIKGYPEPHFSWVKTENFVKAKTLEEAMSEWRWQIMEDEEGNVNNIYFFGDKLGDDRVLFKAIAPFVEEDCFIQMSGEDGSVWRWVFGNEECREKDAELVFR